MESTFTIHNEHSDSEILNEVLFLNYKLYKLLDFYE